MAVVPPRLLSPAQTFRFLHELDCSMGSTYTEEMLGVSYRGDTNFMYLKANSYDEVDAFAVRRFASLLYAQQCSRIDRESYQKLTSAISTLLLSFKTMRDDKADEDLIFPARIDLFYYVT